MGFSWITYSHPSAPIHLAKCAENSPTLAPMSCTRRARADDLLQVSQGVLFMRPDYLSIPRGWHPERLACDGDSLRRAPVSAIDMKVGSRPSTFPCLGTPSRVQRVPTPAPEG